MSDALIVVVCPSLRSGSVAAVAWRHAIELARTHRVVVVARDAPEGHPEIRRELVRPRTWGALRRFAHVPNEIAFALAVRAALRRLASRERVALVWCHSHATAAVSAAPLRARFGFRVALTAHGDIFDRPRGTYPAAQTWFYRQVTPPAYRHSDAVQVLSPYMRDCALRAGADAARVIVVPNGVDLADLGLREPMSRRAESFVPHGVLRILYVGSLWHVKGVDVLLHAAAALARQHAPPPEITLVGEGPDRAALERLAHELGIASHVRFAGARPRHELPLSYGEADVLCVPSHSEAFSLATVEAMLCGLPVVGSATGGIASIVEDGRTGWLFEPGNADALAQRLRDAAQSPEHLAAFGAQGQAKAGAQYAWAAIAPQLDALAESLIATSHPGAAAHGHAA